jgi:hypothetical protein
MMDCRHSNYWYADIRSYFTLGQSRHKWVIRQSS